MLANREGSPPDSGHHQTTAQNPNTSRKIVGGAGGIVTVEIAVKYRYQRFDLYVQIQRFRAD